jgi:hypothetical protein
VPIEESKPPEGVTDAYQKHDCLCVVGGGDGAVHQLYLWCWALERRGVHVSKAERQGRDPVDLLFQGFGVAYLAAGHVVGR